MSDVARVFHAASVLSAAMAAVPSVTLNNGVEMPMMMYGIGNMGDESNLTASGEHFRLALQAGFTAFDTAIDYNNQEVLAQVLAEVERSSVFVSAKVDGVLFSETLATVYNNTMSDALDNLKQLNLDYVDVVLVHHPPCVPPYCKDDPCAVTQEQWRAMEDFLRSGKARAIGVSNFCQSHLECILETATVVPAVNQLMIHAGMGSDPRGTVSYHRAHGIQTLAYSPLGSLNWTVPDPPIKTDNSLVTGNFTRGIGRAYNKTGAQVALRWLTQHGIPFVTDSASMKHLQQDVEVFDEEFSLNEADMQLLDDTTTPVGEPNGGYPTIPVCEPLLSTITA